MASPHPFEYTQIIMSQINHKAENVKTANQIEIWDIKIGKLFNRKYYIMQQLLLLCFEMLKQQPDLSTVGPVCDATQ